MSDAIAMLHSLMRAAHIGLGFLGLAAFWIVVALPKGTPRHVAVGRLFARCGLFVSLSGLVASSWAVLHLPSFLASLSALPDRGLPADAAAFIHMFFSILLYLSTAALSAAVLGIRLARTQQDHDRLASRPVRATCALTYLAAIGLLLYGLGNLAAVLLSQHPLAGGRGMIYLLCVALGWLGIASARQDRRYVFGPRPQLRMGWLYKHIECMVGLGIAFHTAFLVFGARRYFPFMEGPLQMVFWIAPSVIGVAASNAWIRAYQRRFGDLPGDLAREPKPVEPAIPVPVDTPDGGKVPV
jgi:hypothetical protein